MCDFFVVTTVSWSWPESAQSFHEDNRIGGSKILSREFGKTSEGSFILQNLSINMLLRYHQNLHAVIWFSLGFTYMVCSNLWFDE